MSISRRQFILGTASGLILPSYYDKVLSYFENHGEPLIEIPNQADTELLVVDEYGSFQFHLGDPWAEPPVMTVREFALEHCGSEEAYQENWCDGQEVDFDDIADPEMVVECWARHESSNAEAFYLLEGLDLGPDLNRKNAVGEIRFIDGSSPGNDYLGVEAADQVSISLLQKRLNELDTGIRITVEKC
jgi:hypothetical protein